VPAGALSSSAARPDPVSIPQVRQHPQRQATAAVHLPLGKSSTGGHIPRNQERLLFRYQPVAPLIQHVGINIDTEHIHAPAPPAVPAG